MSEVFSPAQSVGYVAFLLGITAFLQKNDTRLKFFNASECLAYTVHFLLLHNPAAATSACISSLRSFLAIRIQSKGLCSLVLAANVVCGLVVANKPTDWLPVLASCLATLGVFTMRGIPLRLILLVSTFCWLANNILSGSIGGTLLEVFIACANITTLVRLRRASRPPKAHPAAN